MPVNHFRIFLLLNKISFVHFIWLLLPVRITYIGIYELVNF